MRRQYLVNYHLHLVARAPALEPGSVVTLDLTPDQERQLVGKSLTLLPPERAEAPAEQPAKAPAKAPAKRKRRASARKP